MCIEIVSLNREYYIIVACFTEQLDKFIPKSSK